jgi:hypothetical protein
VTKRRRISHPIKAEPKRKAPPERSIDRTADGA